MAQINDRRQLGDIIVQDFRDRPPEYLATMCIARVTDRDELGRWIVEGRHSQSQGAPNDGVGHVASAWIWPGRTRNNLAAGHLAATFAVASRPYLPGGQRSKTKRTITLESVDDAQWRAGGAYATIEATPAPGTPGVPKGWGGIVSKTTDTRKQELVFAPAALPLIASNRVERRTRTSPGQFVGHSQLSTPVYEVTKDGALDLDVHAPLHSAWRVVQLERGCAIEKQTVLSWQLGGAGDGTQGYGMCSQFENTHAMFSWMKSGPLHPGPDDRHQLGKDKDGHGVYVGGLYTGAIWRGDGFDMPLEFDTTHYEPASSAGFWAVTVLRPDTEVTHSWACGAGIGKRRWETRVPYFFSEPKDPPGGPEDLPPPPPPRLPPRDPSQPPPITEPPEDPHDGVDPPEIGDPYTTPPLWPWTPSTVRQGVILLSAFATAEGEFDATRGYGYTRDNLDALRNAPDVAALVPFATGDGTWGGWRYSQRPRAGESGTEGGIMEGGGIVFLPPNFRKAEDLVGVLNGVYDPNVDATPAPGPKSHMLIPGGLSTIDFAHPRKDSPQVTQNPTGGGTRLEQTSDGVTFIPLDLDGNEGTNKIAMAEAGLKFSTSSSKSATIDGFTLPTSHVTAKLPDKSGTLAMLSDVGIGSSSVHVFTRRTVGTGTTMVPADDTIPTYAEGDEYLLTGPIDIPAGTSFVDLSATVFLSHDSMFNPYMTIFIVRKALTFLASSTYPVYLSTGGVLTITNPTVDALYNGFEVGMTLVISGTTSNDGAYTITAVTATSITVSTAFTAETSTTGSFAASTDAIAAQMQVTRGGGAPLNMSIRYKDEDSKVAGLEYDSRRQYALRAGVGATGTTTINGSNGSRLLGGAATSEIRVVVFA